MSDTIRSDRARTRNVTSVGSFVLSVLVIAGGCTASKPDSETAGTGMLVPPTSNVRSEASSAPVISNEVAELPTPTTLPAVSGGVATRIAALPFVAAFGFDPLSGYIDVADQEQRTVACMRSRGFEYVAFQPGLTSQNVERSSVALTGRPDPESGYRLSSTFLDESTQSTVADPNEQIRAALGSQELTAYWMALRGVDPNADDGGPAESDSGCIAMSRTDKSATDDAVARLVELARREVAVDARTDVDVRDADEAWVGCMATSGIETESKFAFLDALRAEFAGIYDSVVAANASGTPPQDNTALVTFAAKEARLADLDLACDDKTNFTLTYLDAIGRAEQTFLDENPALLGE